MRKIIQIGGAAAIAIVVGLTTFTPVSAASFVPAQSQATSDIQSVQYRHHDNDNPRWKKRQERRYERVERRQERRGYWNGHRGYREHRRGYRRHSDGYYYAPQVFQLFIR